VRKLRLPPLVAVGFNTNVADVTLYFTVLGGSHPIWIYASTVASVITMPSRSFAGSIHPTMALAAPLLIVHVRLFMPFEVLSR
jgi:hypothetical protein